MGAKLISEVDPLPYKEIQRETIKLERCQKMIK